MYALKDHDLQIILIKGVSFTYRKIIYECLFQYNASQCDAITYGYPNKFDNNILTILGCVPVIH